MGDKVFLFSLSREIWGPVWRLAGTRRSGSVGSGERAGAYHLLLFPPEDMESATQTQGGP